MKILYLEDSELDVKLIQATLAEEDIQFTLNNVRTRDEFVRSLEQSRQNIILVDYALPGFDGLTALELAKEKCPDIPVIIISGKIGEEFAIETLKMGATDYVLKQRLSRLVPAIQRALREAEEHRIRKQAEEQIQRELQEKEILLREIHHRVKNNLQIICSLLNLQARRSTNRELQKLLEDSRNRVFTMALVHEKLYESHDFSKINFKQYAKRMLDELITAYHISGKLSTEIDIESVYLGLDVSIPIALILNELITNALQHAFVDNREGKIKISLHKQTLKNYQLLVQDNGVGLPKQFNINEINTLGINLVQLLTEQIKGKLELQPGNGTTFTVTFPVQQKTKDMV